MSRGADSDEIAEPDLTPLLDLVLQLLMFFIINVNFVSDQVNPDVKLPRSESARPMDKPGEADIFLNQAAKTQRILAKLNPADQERLRKNLEALKGPTSAEQELKGRYVERLGKDEDRIQELAKRRKALQADLAQRQAELDTKVRALALDNQL